MTQRHHATVNRSGEVTIPVKIRDALGLDEGGAVEFAEEDGVIVLRSRDKPTLSELLTQFDPKRHRHAAEERSWDDAPRGAETL